MARKRPRTAAEIQQKYSREYYGDKKNPEKARKRNINKELKRRRSVYKSTKLNNEYIRRFKDRPLEARPNYDEWEGKRKKMSSKKQAVQSKLARVKRIKKLPGSPPGGWNKFKTRGSATAAGLRGLLGPAIAVEAGSAAIRQGSAIAKKKQTTSQRRAIGEQDRRMMKKYKKKDPKKQATFKKLMRKKTTIYER